MDMWMNIDTQKLSIDIVQYIQYGGFYDPGFE